MGFEIEITQIQIEHEINVCKTSNPLYKCLLNVQLLDPTQKVTVSERKEEDCDQTFLVMY